MTTGTDNWAASDAYKNYVWDYADGMEFLRRFWDEAAALDPAADGGGPVPRRNGVQKSSKRS